MNKLKIVKSIELLSIIAPIIYIICNFETILIFSYWDNKDNKEHLWLLFQQSIKRNFGDEKGNACINIINHISWWFVENNKNIIFFICIMILTAFCIHVNRNNLTNRPILIVFYVLTFLVMFFIAFFATPKFIEYYF